MERDDVAREKADAIVLATGALPAETGFQKALPQIDILPGLDKGQVFSVESVMAREARPGHRVIVLDEGGGWRGCGTAWKLAEDGHEVTLVTPDPMVGKELQRVAADDPLRKILRRLGVRFVIGASVSEWHGDGAEILSHDDGDRIHIAADSLVLATTNVASDWLAQDLRSGGLTFHEIGDGVAPRQAAFAIHEGRKVGLTI
jgi:NADPH-dependent 2,4-dienoyl-CoA reductase/sulfur reductase-like enzyme